MGSFLKDYGPAFAWIVAAIGWAVTNRQANTREKRKEFRAEIEAIEIDVMKVVKKLEKYVRRIERDDKALVLESEIVSIFKTIDSKVERIQKRQSGGTLGLYVDVVVTRKEDLYDFATGEYFHTSSRVPPDEVTARVQKFYAKGLLLNEALHNLFLMKFDQISSDLSA